MEIRPRQAVIPVAYGKRVLELRLTTRAECRELIAEIARASETLPEDGDGLLTLMAYSGPARPAAAPVGLLPDCARCGHQAASHGAGPGSVIKAGPCACADCDCAGWRSAHGMAMDEAYPPADACAECGHLACDCAADMGDDPTDSIAESHDAELAAAVLAGPVAAGTPVVITCGLPVWGDEDRPCELPAGHGPVVSCSAAAAPDAGTVLLAGLRAERGTGA